jgi:EAL domain-containing protein (putative c-di-GMP-specific phosphodiesterase class I)
MGLEVIAEGVETEQQLKLVTQFGADLAQGYFIGRPMPAEEFIDWCQAVDQTTNDLPVLPDFARQRG